jgi:hypothetical protein
MTVQEIIKLIDAVYYLTAAGTNTYTASSPAGVPPLQSYVAGRHYYVKFTNANTGACTLNIDGLGEKNLYKIVSTPMALGDIPAGDLVLVVYDGTNFQTLGGQDLLSIVNQKINSAAANFNQSII